MKQKKPKNQMTNERDHSRFELHSPHRETVLAKQAIGETRRFGVDVGVALYQQNERQKREQCSSGLSLLSQIKFSMKPTADKSRRGDVAKFALWLGLALVIPLPAAAQGTVNFNNHVGSVNAPITDLDGTKLSGSAFLAQLYAGPSICNLTAVGSPVAFLTGSSAGYFAGGTLAI